MLMEFKVQLVSQVGIERLILFSFKEGSSKKKSGGK